VDDTFFNKLLVPALWSRYERIEDRTGEGALQIAELEITTESMTRGSVVA